MTLGMEVAEVYLGVSHKVAQRAEGEGDLGELLAGEVRERETETATGR